MTKAMGRRLPIVVAEGNRRPHDPVQAAKFASESGVVVRNTVPVLPHWKDYKRNINIKDSFVGGLCVSALLIVLRTCTSAQPQLTN
jgi:hypothetical protein